jgi:hypothetical protein
MGRPGGGSAVKAVGEEHRARSCGCRNEIR